MQSRLPRHPQTISHCALFFLSPSYSIWFELFSFNKDVLVSGDDEHCSLSFSLSHSIRFFKTDLIRSGSSRLISKSSRHAISRMLDWKPSVACLNHMTRSYPLSLTDRERVGVKATMSEETLGLFLFVLVLLLFLSLGWKYIDYCHSTHGHTYVCHLLLSIARRE